MIEELVHVLQVAMPIPLPQLFDYLPPEGVAISQALIGCRVVAPFGRRQLVGVVAGVGVASPDLRMKRVEAILDATAVFTREQWESLGWASRYYHYPLGEVLAAAMPGALRRGKNLPESRRWRWELTPLGRSRLGSFRPGTRTHLVAHSLAEGDSSAASRDLLSTTSSRPTLRALERKGLISRTLFAEPSAVSSIVGARSYDLNEAQSSAIRQISASLGRFSVTLLDGITGSGKTEVYLGAIEACLARGKQALVLVPEIGLTPQALRRYGERLPVAVHAVHSGLGDTERARAWAAMASGERCVLIGTRSAVFAPLDHAGLIVVDEEHDASYKQQEGFRYHARDFALVRAKALGVAAVLGSATPSLETIRQALKGRYTTMRLPSRAGSAQPPTVHVVDIRKKALHDGLSSAMLETIGECLRQGNQAMVFRNRRGYAPVVMCHDCGWSARCERCDSPMTQHGTAGLLCHHCAARKRVPKACPACGGLALLPLGAGTERLASGLAAVFPDARVVRVDKDTTQSRGALDQHLAALGDEPGIVVGTQLLAKGHDLPLLTLVAIASIDEGLFSADFRASERLAQMLVQVSGRAGRSIRPGQVWLQTHHPDHPLLQTLLGGGYNEFAKQELAVRDEAGFPPFAHLALLRAEATEHSALFDFLGAAQQAALASQGVELSPPLSAPMPLRDGKHRGQMLLTARQRPRLQAALEDLVPVLRAMPTGRKVRWSMDVDPIDLY
jgi:primosomal protein N' (replication factor Y) (superfamily II helicase)